MFTGTHQLAVDEKGRMAIPARFRQLLSEEADPQLVITRGPNPCIEIYPRAVFEDLVRQLQDMEDREQAEALKQVIVGFAVETEMDKQGRVLLPPMLRRRAGLDGAAMLMGQDRRFDVWSLEAWEARFGEEAEPMVDLKAAFRTLKR